MKSRRLLLTAFFMVNLTVINSCDDKSTEPQQPVLSVSPLTIDFGADQLGLHFLINNSGGSTLEWNVENTAQTWYQYSPSGGTTGTETDTVEVMVDRTGLSGGFTDTLTVTSNGGTSRVAILMEVPESPTLSVYPVSLDFGVDEETSFFRIENTGPGQLDWNITEDIEWLELGPASGSTVGGEPDTITVTIERPYQSNAALSGEILISSNGGSRTIGVAARDTVFTQEGIYAFLTLERNITSHHMGYQRDDLISARFDNSYTPCEPGDPLMADSVYCSEYTLLWNAEKSSFEYDQTMPRTFLVLGDNYFFDIAGNSTVPSFTDSVTFPLYAPFLTSPVDSATVSRSSDLALEWSGVGENQVTVSLILSSDSICALPYDVTGLHGINVETDNDGQYIILSSQLSGLDAGEYRLILSNYNAHGISAGGYHSDSFIMAKTTSYVTVYLQ